MLNFRGISNSISTLNPFMDQKQNMSKTLRGWSHQQRAFPLHPRCGGSSPPGWRNYIFFVFLSREIPMMKPVTCHNCILSWRGPGSKAKLFQFFWGLEDDLSNRFEVFANAIGRFHPFGSLEVEGRISLWINQNRFSRVTPPKINMSPEIKGPFQKEITSSNHWFSGDM